MKDKKLSRKQQSRLAATKGGQAFARKCLLAKVETNLKEVVYSSTDIANLTPDEQAIAMEKCKEVYNTALANGYFTSGEFILQTIK